MYRILTQQQADDIEALIATLPNGRIRDYLTVNPKAGKLVNGAYALQSTLAADLDAEGINYIDALLSIGIDADTLPEREVADSEWDKTGWDE